MNFCGPGSFFWEGNPVKGNRHVPKSLSHAVPTGGVTSDLFLQNLFFGTSLRFLRFWFAEFSEKQNNKTFGFQH